MCYGDEARPPAPPVQGPVGETGDLVLTSADGTQFAAYFAHPAEASGKAIVILPDVRGLHSFYKELAVRFAEAGLHAIAFDYFGRTAGLGSRDEEFPYREHIEKLEPASVTADVAASAAWLREHTSATSVFSVGFCFGGSGSWRQSAAGLDLAGCMGFYGIPSRAEDVVSQMRAPLLMLAAGQDFTPVEVTQEFADRVRAGGVDAEVHVYPDAPHSFFDRTFGEHRDACADAWVRMLGFVDRHSAG